MHKIGHELGPTIRDNAPGEAEVLSDKVMVLFGGALGSNSFVTGNEMHHLGWAIDANHDTVVTPGAREVSNKVTRNNIPIAVGNLVGDQQPKRFLTQRLCFLMN